MAWETLGLPHEAIFRSPGGGQCFTAVPEPHYAVSIFKHNTLLRVRHFPHTPVPDIQSRCSSDTRLITREDIPLPDNPIVIVALIRDTIATHKATLEGNHHEIPASRAVA